MNAPCGTAAAARRHYKRGEPLDEDCKAAVRREKADRSGGQSSVLSIDRREIRNDMPEFIPYKYRGTGHDTLTGNLTPAELAAAEIEAVGYVRE